MPRIGIIGGAGPQAGSALFNSIIKKKQSKGAWRDSDFPFISLLNVPFADMLLQKDAQQQQAILRSQLQEAFDQLRLLNCTDIVIACNTLHTLLPYCSSNSMIVHSLVEVTHRYMQSKAISNIIFFGTQTSYQAGLYSHPDINIEQLDSKTLDTLHTIIVTVLANKHNPATAQQLAQLIDNFKYPVLLGCTEFSVLIEQYPIETRNLFIDPLQLAAGSIINNP